MKTIDRLSDRHVLALARFIVGCAERRMLSRWRARFGECLKRGSFAPYVTSEDQAELRLMVKRHTETIVCGLPTTQIMEAGNKVAHEWNEPPLALPTPASAESATAAV